jgi:hypothetical protein
MLSRLKAELEAKGLLLLADATRPAVAQLVAGGPIAGSWWGHPDGKAIFNLANALEADPEVLVVKLVDGKVTFVHRRLWPAVLAIATARAPRQTSGLSPAANAALARVDAEGLVPAGAIPTPVARELGDRLLARVFEEHLPSGKHGKGAESWARWAAARGVGGLSPEAGRVVLAAAVDAIGGGRIPG